MRAPSNGQQLGNMAVVEFFAKEKPESRLDVVLHEFSHFLYQSRSDAQSLAFQNRFIAAHDLAAKPSFNLLNEGMATAFGNGMIGRKMTPADKWLSFQKKPLSFYNNPNIDRAGKRLLRLMDDWLPTGKTIDDPSFVPAYIAAIKEEFGDELTSPSLFLGEAFLYLDDRFGKDVSNDLRHKIHIGSLYSSIDTKLNNEDIGEWSAQSNLSSVFVIPKEQLDSLSDFKVLSSDDVGALRQYLDHHKSALFARARGSMAFTYVIVAEDKAEAMKRGNQLATAKRSGDGLFPEVEP